MLLDGYNSSHLSGSLDDDGVPFKTTWGGKAEGLFKMQNAFGLNVPKWFAVPCADSITASMAGDSWFHHSRTEIQSMFRARFGLDEIVSVRSGAPVSMPGMMDTLLNVGIDDHNFDLLVEKHGDIAYQLRARLIRQFSVMEGDDDDAYAEAEHHVQVFYGLEGQTPEYNKALYESYAKVRDRPMPLRMDQLWQAVKWVWESYNSERAKAYRDIHDLNQYMGTAVVIQKMVFGNLNENSGTGVAFSHDPNTGIEGMMGDFLAQGQGEEVVSGEAAVTSVADIGPGSEFFKPIRQLKKTMKSLTQTAFEMADVEFTIEDGQLWFLQVREAKCSKRAKVNLLMDRVAKKTLGKDAATDRLCELLDIELNLDLGDKGTLLATALGAVDGAAAGKIATTHEQAALFHEEGTPFIFVAEATSPTDLIPMSRSAGILTRSGGMLSHAALIAREWGKVAVVACDTIEIASATEIVVDGNAIDYVQLHVENQEGKVFNCA